MGGRWRAAAGLEINAEELGGAAMKNRDGLNRQARNPVRLPDGNPASASAERASGDDIIDPHRQVGTPRDAHKIMTPEEYAAMPIIGWHEVCHNVDGFGAVGIRFLGLSLDHPAPAAQGE